MHWYYSKEHTDSKTPSRADGVEFETEFRYRKEGSRFIMELGNKLGLRYLTMATGIVFFHRFYMNQSFKNFSRWVTGTACLFLAGKVEETPKKCKDVLKMCRAMLADQQWEAFGDNPREEVMMLERILLQTIKFDLQVDHPYQYLIKYGKDLKGDKERVNELVQKAWIFINDSLSTCICLHYKPNVVALAMFHLAAKLSKQNMQNFTPVPRQDWWRHFSPEVEQSVLDDICNEMMDLYDASRHKSKSREGSVSKSKEGSVTESPAYTPSGSPQVTGSPPSKKKRSQSSSLGDGQKAKDSPLMKPLQVENVSPPMVVKAPSNPPLPPHSTPKPNPPTVNSVQSHGHYFQQGFETAMPQVKDAVPMIPDVNQQILAPIPMMQNAQTLGSMYPHGIPVHNQGMPAAPTVPPTPPLPHVATGQPLPPHGQVMPPREQIPMGIEQGHYPYSLGQPQQPLQQPSFHSFVTTQMATANQWPTQQPGLGPGWMK